MLKLEDEITEVMTLRDQEPPVTFKEIAERLGFSESTAKRRYTAGTLATAANQVLEMEDDEPLPTREPLDIKVTGPFLPEDLLPEIVRFKPVEIHDDNVIVTSDWHLPLFDAKLVNRMIADARAYNVKRLIINGDYWNMDTFGHFKPGQPEGDWENYERPVGNLVMKTLLESFEEIIIGWGNHDHRLAKKNGFKYSFEECMRWAFDSLSDDEWSRLTISELDYMHLFAGGRKYRVCHPKNFSTLPLSVARSLAEKHHCSVITGHSHHIAMGMARDGTNIVIECGGFYSKDHTEYVQKTSKFHEWAKGYIQFFKGAPLIKSPHFDRL